MSRSGPRLSPSSSSTSLFLLPDADSDANLPIPLLPPPPSRLEIQLNRLQKETRELEASFNRKLERRRELCIVQKTAEEARHRLRRLVKNHAKKENQEDYRGRSTQQQEVFYGSMEFFNTINEVSAGIGRSIGDLFFLARQCDDLGEVAENFSSAANGVIAALHHNTSEIQFAEPQPSIDCMYGPPPSFESSSNESSKSNEDGN